MKNNYKPTLVVKVSLFIIVFFTVTIYPIAQVNIKLVSGTVTNIENKPLPGVNVLIKNKNRGTTTQLDGSWELLATPQDTLVFSFLGFKSIHEPVGNKTIINVKLLEDATALEQVVLNAGYYKVSDIEKTGSISKVTAKEIEKQPVANFLGSLQGRSPGLDIQQTTGVPGSGFEILIRGQNSIAAGNRPLYVIDGVPFESGSLGFGNASGPIIANANISPLSAINPTDIKSIEILKDADATAIYGSRGANGVIIISTKKGKASKTQYKIGTSTGVASITKKIDLLNTQQYLEMRREAFGNDGVTEIPTFAYDVNGTWDRNRDTDWQDELIGGTAYTTSVSAGVSGGNEQTTFLLNGNYRNETTVFPGDYNYYRATIHSQLNHTSENRKFTINLTTNYSIEDNDLPGADLTFYTRLLPPNAPALFDENGDLNFEDGTFDNPLAQLESKYLSKRNNLIANSVLTYKFSRHLEGKVNLGYTDTRLDESRTYPNTVFNPDFGLTSEISSIFKNQSSRNSFIIEPQLRWTPTLGFGELDILLGSTFQKRSASLLNQYGSGFASNDLINSLSAASTVLIFKDQNIDYKYQAVFGRINYVLDNKYIINLTGRRDGSSRFGPGKRFENFGAIGAAYIFSKEPITKDTFNFLSYGKLRSSYGTTGNDQIGDYGYLDTYSTTGVPYNGTIGIGPTRLFNPNYSWETNKKLNFGLELGFVQNRINLSVDHYRNRSSNQLTGIPLAATTGFQSLQANLAATVENRGWEFSLTSENFKTKDFNWNTSFNLTVAKNELISFPGLKESSFSNQYVVGEPITIRKLYHFTGIDAETGVFQFEDYNNDGNISAPDDQQQVVDLAPDYYGGLSNQLTYKNWDLSFFFQFKKQKAFNNFRNGTAPGIMVNQPVSVLDRWQQPGDSGFMQLYTTGSNAEATEAFSNYGRSDASISDGSYVRLKNISLSYLLPENILDARCRIYLQAQNVLTITKYNAGDPEQLKGFLPPLRQLSFGFDLTL
ncbi:SusC/RagA family TonB-linked outer membrane protein [Marixanthomonas ophiurae]|uniref:SusC/RagA family TonB-linked outer membrane protein n=1 Tax=Marixanthomonas ophiurae TaxID=387659 RepID=A0A3E1QE00_9FLAO|nr:SusC/RagA family TonB-linked outer membrane protein [Marixanthomonas ophiurae]RFN60337.1 SusC/RagA family TonB-linked outer membrane protein [Marixanthomonas ophiurae]